MTQGGLTWARHSVDDAGGANLGQAFCRSEGEAGPRDGSRGVGERALAPAIRGCDMFTGKVDAERTS